MRYLISIITILLLVYSCKKEQQTEIDDEIIVNYLSANGIEATKHESGLYYFIEKHGSGPQPGINSEVTVRYKGYFTDGSVFDETPGSSTATFFIYQLITAWQIGIPMLKAGGNGTFFVPSHLGYGIEGTPGIPANTVLIFDIELLDVN